MYKRQAKVYVGTYAKYNNGSLSGAWLDRSDYSDKEEFYEACRELHKDEEDAEYMFQDYETYGTEQLRLHLCHFDKLQGEYAI